MTINELIMMIGKIERKKGDDEAAHCLEDDMRERVLQAIAAGDCMDPAELARIALTSSEIPFERWCA